jgi:hypothetical protein
MCHDDDDDLNRLQKLICIHKYRPAEEYRPAKEA